MKYDTKKYEIHTKKVDELHKKRIAFLIIEGQPIFVKNSTKSHLEIVKDLGVDEKDFDKITRGLFRDDYIVFYCGNFETNARVEADAKKYCTEICNNLKLHYVKVYCGVTIGKVGDAWEPLKLIGVVENHKYIET